MCRRRSDGALTRGGIAFWDADHGLAVGTGADGAGIVERTTDGGATWRALRLGSPALGEVDVTGEGQGWATVECPASAPAGSCHVGLLRTSDGGVSWHAVTGVVLTGLSFGDGAHGWAFPVGAQQAGLPTFVLRSDDGGTGWRSVGSPCTGTGLEPAAVSLADPLHGWVACAGLVAAAGQPKGIVATTDGGATWTLRALQDPASTVPAATPSKGLPLPAASPRAAPGGLPLAGFVVGLAMRPGGAGWLWLSKGGVLATANGGATWKPVAVPGVGAAAPLSAAPLDGGLGYILLRDSTTGGAILLATADAGKSWRELVRWSALPA